jgi:hypothetical protein
MLDALLGLQPVRGERLDLGQQQAGDRQRPPNAGAHNAVCRRAQRIEAFVLRRRCLQLIPQHLKTGPNGGGQLQSACGSLFAESSYRACYARPHALGILYLVKLGHHAGSLTSLGLAIASALVAVAAAILHVGGVWSRITTTLGGLALAVAAGSIAQWRTERSTETTTGITADQMQSWCRKLRGAILDHRVRAGSQLDQMLGQSSAINPRTVRFELTEGQDGVPKIRYKGSAVPFKEVIAEWDHERTRLVITADPGYGKTVASLTLLSHINGHVDVSDRPIAELFPLAEWYRWHLGHAKEPLTEWLANQLVTNYQVTDEVARTLITNDRILPLLDGLDELPATDQLACMEAIDGYAGRAAPFRPFVLTCRAQEYRDLAPHWVGTDQQIALLGLDGPQISGILRPWAVGRPDWAVIRDGVEAGNQTLLHVLRSPLRLNVVLQAYKERDPSELLSFRPAAAQEHVWHLLLNLESPRYASARQDNVYSWLVYLAAKMQSLSTSQFRLHELYRYAPNRTSVFRHFRISFGLSVGLVAGLLIGLIYAFSDVSASGQAGNDVGDALAGVALFGSVFSVVALRRTEEVPVARLPMALAVRRTLPWVVVGLCLGAIELIFAGNDWLITSQILSNPVANEWIRGMLTAVAFALVLGLFVLVFGSVSRSTRPPAKLAARGPEAILVGSRYRWLVAGFGGWLAGALLGIRYPVEILVFGLFAGLFGSVFGGMGTWLYHYRVRLLLVRKGLAPWRLSYFLAWCAAPERGWLRVSDGYEFRHRDLRDYLASQWAAESAAGLGAQYCEDAAVAQRQVLADRHTDASALQSAAKVLAGLGPQYRKETAAKLLKMIANRGTDASARQSAAESLAGLGPQYREEAVEALRRVVADRHAGPSARQSAAESLARLGPQYRKDAVEALRQVVAGRQVGASARQSAAKVLAGLGPQYREEAVATLRKMIADRGTGAYTRQSAAGALAGLGPQYREEAVATLRDVIVDRGAGAYDRQSAVGTLAGLGPQYREEAVATLRKMIADRSTGMFNRRSAAGALAGLGVHSDAVKEVDEAAPQ